MRFAVLAAAVMPLIFISALFAADLPAASTTLPAETANNTSAAPTFFGQQNGNAGAGNISKLPIRSLLYPGATTKIYAHVEPWWGSSKHPDIGYSSHDPEQVRRQVADMISRGLDGAVADWYGPDSYEALGVKLLVTEAESHPNFGVFVEVEHGAVLWDSCYPGCNATTAAIQLFTRVANDFFASPAYVRMGGRPVVREFAMESIPLPAGQADLTWNKVEWSAVQKQVPGNPLIIHRNLGGFSIAQSGGAFTWMEPKTLSSEPLNYDGTDELVWFYSNAISTYGAMPSFGAAWKGFNDILASWAPPGGRHIEQNCGQTWLRTFATINRYYSASRQLPALQLVTWNDYEEGTEVESGIDNCVSVAASLAGSLLQWKITGDETTIDHYTVFLSGDGENLAALADVPAGTKGFDVSSFTIPPGTYSLFVKAVGKPSLRNQMSPAVTLTVATQPAGLKDITVSATPSSAQVTRGGSAQFTLALTQSGAADPVALSCSNLPAGATCAFSPASITPGSQASSVALTISTAAMTSAYPRKFPIFALFLPGIVGICVLPVLSSRSHRRERLSSRAQPPRLSFRAQRGISVFLKLKLKLFLLLMLTLLLLVQLACGGWQSKATSAQSPTSPSTTTSAGTAYTITVNATSGTVTRSTTVNLTVQ